MHEACRAKDRDSDGSTTCRRFNRATIYLGRSGQVLRCRTELSAPGMFSGKMDQ